MILSAASAYPLLPRAKFLGALRAAEVTRRSADIVLWQTRMCGTASSPFRALQPRVMPDGRLTCILSRLGTRVADSPSFRNCTVCNSTRCSTTPWPQPLCTSCLGHSAAPSLIHTCVRGRFMWPLDGPAKVTNVTELVLDSEWGLEGADGRWILDVG